MGLLLPVAVGLGAYTILAMAADRRGWLPDAVGVQGPILTLHTERGIDLLTRLARPKRLWRAWGNLGVGIAIVVMVGTFGFLAASAAALVRNPPPATSINQPRNVLVIPGVNDFLPLSVAPEIVTGLAIGLIVHEGGHGLLCRVEDIEIESMGLALLAVVPIGAFVEPDEASRDRCDRGGQTRMFAAGVMNNFAVSVVAFALLFGPVTGAIAVAPGAPIAGAFEGSPADRAGIDRGDRITAVDGAPVTDGSDLAARLDATDAERVDVALNDGRRTVSVERAVLVVGASADAPAGVPANTTITAVNGTPVHTVAGFREAVAAHEVARLSTMAGERTVPMGAHAIRVEEGGPLATAGAPAGASLVITRIDGERVLSFDDLSGVLDRLEPGQRVSVRAYRNGSPNEYAVTLGEDDRGGGYVGIRGSRGISGLVLSDFGTRAYPAAEYLGLLGEGDGGTSFGPLTDSPIGRVVVALFLPVAGAFGLPENFAGFTGGVGNFFVVEGPLAPFGGGVFLLANLLFWVAWINIQLGFFNCIPAFPLDGGHILRTSTEAILSRLPFEPRREHVRVVTTAVGLTMLLSLLVTLFGPQVL